MEIEFTHYHRFVYLPRRQMDQVGEWTFWEAQHWKFSTALQSTLQLAQLGASWMHNKQSQSATDYFSINECIV